MTKVSFKRMIKVSAEQDLRKCSERVCEQETRPGQDTTW